MQISQHVHPPYETYRLLVLQLIQVGQLKQKTFDSQMAEPQLECLYYTYLEERSYS
jgi:hypothetical protein